MGGACILGSCLLGGSRGWAWLGCRDLRRGLHGSHAYGQTLRLKADGNCAGALLSQVVKAQTLVKAQAFTNEKTHQP